MDDLAKRHLVVEDDALAGTVLEMLEHAAPILAELHHRADIDGRDDDRQLHERLRDRFDGGGIRQQGRIVDVRRATTTEMDLVLDSRRGRDQLELELALEALLHDLEMQQAQEATPKAEAERRRVLGLVRKSGVVQLQLLERLLQV